MPRPIPGTYYPYFDTYIQQVKEDDVNDALASGLKETEELLNSISEERSLYKYAENKWSIKEVLQHIIDAERIFTYRALAFARKDPNTLHSFDENSYAANSKADAREWKDLIKEFFALRQSTQWLFKGFTEDQLAANGKASNYEMTVNAMGFTTAGHATHHIKIIKERYLTDQHQS